MIYIYSFHNQQYSYGTVEVLDNFQATENSQNNVKKIYTIIINI